MELREAIEKLTMWHQANPRTGPLGVVMNAVADGTLIPAQSREEGHPASYDPEYSYDDWMKEQTQPTPSPEPVAWRARHSKTENWHLFEYRPSWWEVQPLYTSPPTHADAVFQVKEGYEVGAAKVDADGNLQRISELSEALEIRSADDVLEAAEKRIAVLENMVQGDIEIVECAYKERAEKAEAERDQALASVGAVIEKAAELTATGFHPRDIRALNPDATAALNEMLACAWDEGNDDACAGWRAGEPNPYRKDVKK